MSAAGLSGLYNKNTDRSLYKRVSAGLAPAKEGSHEKGYS